MHETTHETHEAPTLVWATDSKQEQNKRDEMPSIAVSSRRGLSSALPCPTVVHRSGFYAQEKGRLEREIKRLADFKAEFENLVQSSLDDSDSNGTPGDGGEFGAGGGPDEKWKLRAKKIQKYAKWQLAEAENQVPHPLDLTLLPPTMDRMKGTPPLFAKEGCRAGDGEAQGNLCCVSHIVCRMYAPTKPRCCEASKHIPPFSAVFRCLACSSGENCELR